MKVVLICLALLWVAFLGYARNKNPAGFLKLEKDIATLVISLVPGHSSELPAAPEVAETRQAPPPPIAASPAVVPASATLPTAKGPTLTPPTEPSTAVAAAALPVPPVITAPPEKPFTRWEPPATLPAQPNWTWTTTLGKTYENVSITTLKADSVVIMHSMGVATVPISTLPPDLQKQLNYDPKAAEASVVEAKREQEHPYYKMAEFAEAKNVARLLQWPIAWVSSQKEFLTAPSPATGTAPELTQLVLDYLKDKSVVIFIDANAEMGQTPPIVHHQFSERDDGPLPGNANYLAPKVVFSNSEATTTYSRVSNTQLTADRLSALEQAMLKAKSDATP